MRSRKANNSLSDEEEDAMILASGYSLYNEVRSLMSERNLL